MRRHAHASRPHPPPLARPAVRRMRGPRPFSPWAGCQPALGREAHTVSCVAGGPTEARWNRTDPRGQRKSCLKAWTLITNPLCSDAPLCRKLAARTRKEDPLLCPCAAFGPSVGAVQLEEPQAADRLQPAFLWARCRRLHARVLPSSAVAQCKSAYTLDQNVVTPVPVRRCGSRATSVPARVSASSCPELS